MNKSIEELDRELSKLKDKLKHISTEYAQSREGSRYGVEYFEIQSRVYESMIGELASEIEQLKAKKS